MQFEKVGELLRPPVELAINIGKVILYEFKSSSSIMKASGEAQRAEAMRKLKENIDGINTN